jgi:hypothetical protein
MKKISLLISTLVLLLTFSNAPSVEAAALTSLTDTISSSVVSTLANHEIKFVTPTGVEANTDTITVTFPAQFTMGVFDVLNVDLAVGNSNNCTTAVFTEKTIAAAAGLSPIWGASQLGQVITFTAPTDSAAGEITADRCVRIRIGSSATEGGAGTTQITNPAIANDYTIAIGGAFGDTGNSTGAINPAAITNLFCQTPNQGGAVYLTWTVPAGVTGGYLIRYSSGDITAQNLFNAATNYVNTFVSGTPGQSSGSNLLVGLAPNATYFFNVEALGAGTSQAAISNTGVVCRIGSGASSSTTTLAAAAPKSSIVSPTDNSSVPAEATVTIRGISSDTEASSIAKVEISTDGGSTWFDTVPTASNNTYGFDWEYVWTNPAEGPHLLKTRATDRAGNIETPSAGITVTIGQKAGIIYVPAEQMPTTGTPAAAANETQIRAQITTIQQQIVVLIQQLIAQLLVELQALL